MSESAHILRRTELGSLDLIISSRAMLPGERERERGGGRGGRGLVHHNHAQVLYYFVAKYTCMQYEQKEDRIMP